MAWDAESPGRTLHVKEAWHDASESKPCSVSCLDKQKGNESSRKCIVTEAETHNWNMCGQSNGKVGTEVLEAHKVLLLQSGACSLFGCWVNEQAECWSFAGVFMFWCAWNTRGAGMFHCCVIEEPGNMQMTQILNVRKGWLAEELRHLFVAVRCDRFISSYPGIVSSSMQGDADTINLFFIIKVQMRHLFWVETKQLDTKCSNPDLMNALLFDVSEGG